jgi:hypothetical protein
VSREGETTGEKTRDAVELALEMDGGDLVPALAICSVAFDHFGAILLIGSLACSTLKPMLRLLRANSPPHNGPLHVHISVCTLNRVL